MSDHDGLFDWKHLNLWKISSRADVLSSIVVLIFAFLTLGEAYRYSQLAQNQFQINLIGLFTQEPIFILDVLFQMARVFLQGAVYYLVLKGIALGLDMIVETDINYRERKGEGGTE